MKYFKKPNGFMLEYDPSRHDLESLKDRFEAMPCFQKYKSYTNSNNLPKFVREIEFA